VAASASGISSDISGRWHHGSIMAAASGKRRHRKAAMK